MGADLLTDSRQGSNQQHLLVPLLRQSIYSRLAGYEDVNDAKSPASLVTLLPQNGSIIRLSKLTRKSPFFASPIGSF